MFFVLTFLKQNLKLKNQSQYKHKIITREI